MKNEKTLTLDEVKNLTDEELRLKVAEICGWTEMRKTVTHITFDEDERPCWWVGRTPDHTLNTRHGGAIYEYMGAEAICIVPDYPNDLNAMREAEEKLGVGYFGYARVLAWNVHGKERVEKNGLNDGVLFDCIHATARQRAEAFVLTMQHAS